MISMAGHGDKIVGITTLRIKATLNFHHTLRPLRTDKGDASINKITASAAPTWAAGQATN